MARAPGLRISRRALDRLQEEHKLSDVEMFQAVMSWVQLRLRYMLRIERHGDPDIAADEEQP